MLQREWEVWPAKNKFFCNGRCISGPDSLQFGFTLALICVPSFFYFLFIAPVIWMRVSPVLVILFGYTLILSLANLFVAHWRDPGIIPRKKKQSEDESYQGESNRNRVPIDVVVCGKSQQLKFCKTCQIYRPPRSSHCSTCDNCVERFDHHCPWVGNCVGLRNYRFFYFFVLCTTFNLIYCCATSVLALYVIASQSESTGIMAVGDAIAKLPAGIAIALLTFFLLWSVGGLACYHAYLIYHGITTNEDLKGATKRPRPYDRGFKGNCLFTLCGPCHPSYLDLSKVYYNPDEPLPPPVSLQV